MEAILSNLLSFTNDNKLSIHRCQNIDAIFRDFQLCSAQNSSSLLELISKVNTALNSSRLRFEGLLLLQHILQQCHTSVLQKYGSTWTSLLVSTLQSFDPYQTLSLASVVTCNLLKHLSQFPELSRNFVNSSLPALINALLAAKPQWQCEAVKCLCQCMKLYPGACGPSKNKIEQLAVQLIEAESAALRETGCECYALLARLGGGGTQGVKHTESWMAYNSKVLASLQKTLSTLYECVDLDEDNESSPTSVGMRLQSAISEEPFERCLQLSERLQILVNIAVRMLCTEFPAPVNVPVKGLLSFIQRTLLVTPNLLTSRTTQEKIALHSVLPSVYLQTLKLFNALINSLSSNLVPHCGVINRCLLQVLKATEVPRNYGVNSAYGSVRAQVWKTLHLWISRVGPASGIEYQMEEFYKHIDRDITPLEDTVKVQSKGSKKFAEVSEQYAGGKKKKKGGSADIGQITTQRKIDPNADCGVCRGALKAFTLILQTTGPLLKIDIYKNFTRTAMTILLRSSPKARDNAPIPYSNSDCRVALYKALLESVVSYHPRLAPPTNSMVSMFRMGTQDRCPKVSAACRQELSVLEAIVHPRAPTLHSPTMNASFVQNNSTQRGQDYAHHVDKMDTYTIESAQNLGRTSVPRQSTLFSESTVSTFGTAFETSEKSDGHNKSSLRETSSLFESTDDNLRVKSSMDYRDKDKSEGDKSENVKDSSSEDETESDDDVGGEKESETPEHLAVAGCVQGGTLDGEKSKSVQFKEQIMSEPSPVLNDSNNGNMVDIDTNNGSDLVKSDSDMYIKHDDESKMTEGNIGKRKYEESSSLALEDEAGPSKRQELDGDNSQEAGVDLMLQSFVDAAPDSE